MSDTEHYRVLQMATSKKQLTNDEIFELLSNSRRSQVIFLLYKNSGTGNLADIAESIAEQEQGPSVNRDEYKRVYISLYQTHVPKLQDFGVVEYDPESKQLELTNRVDDIIDLFRSNQRTRQWWRYYAALAAISASVLAVYVITGQDGNATDMVIAFSPLIALLVLVALHSVSHLRGPEVPIDRLIN